MPYKHARTLEFHPVSPLDPKAGRFAREKSELPVHDLFRTLCEMWCEKKGRGSQTKYASWLGVTYESTKCWRNGKFTPPWWVIIATADALDLAIILTGDHVGLQKKKKPTEPGSEPAGK